MKILADFSGLFGGGLPEAAQLIIDRYGRSAGGQCWRRFTETNEEYKNLLRGRISEAEYFDIFFAKVDLPFGKEKLSEIFSEAFRTTIPGTLNLYKRIISYPRRMNEGVVLERGRPDLYIVSDYIKERIDEIKKSHKELFRLAKGELWSCEIGRVKTDPGYFPDLLRQLNLEADDVVFIDDDINNTRAAEAAGITGITFSNNFQFRSCLRNLGFRLAPNSM